MHQPSSRKTTSQRFVFFPKRVDRADFVQQGDCFVEFIACRGGHGLKRIGIGSRERAAGGGHKNAFDVIACLGQDIFRLHDFVHWLSATLRLWVGG